MGRLARGAFVHPLEVWVASEQREVSGGQLGFHQKRKYIPEYGIVSWLRVLQLIFVSCVINEKERAT